MLSKALLCKKSTYFLKMFEGNYAEASTSYVTLQEDATTFKPSFELFIEWLYLGKFTLPEEDRASHISCLLNLARFADMSVIDELTDLVARSIEQIITEDPDVKKKREAPTVSKYGTSNVRHLTTRHVKMVGGLPTGNAVRRVLIIALVEPYLRAECFIPTFADRIVQYPNLAFDLLTEVRQTMLAAVPRAGKIWIKDPLTQIEVSL
ncbi:hypothetical protein BO86DRAFT_390185, partial [Aspergillus japonicus CBS 114.51]